MNNGHAIDIVNGQSNSHFRGRTYILKTLGTPPIQELLRGDLLYNIPYLGGGLIYSGVYVRYMPIFAMLYTISIPLKESIILRANLCLILVNFTEKNNILNFTEKILIFTEKILKYEKVQKLKSMITEYKAVSLLSICILSLIFL